MNRENTNQLDLDFDKRGGLLPVVVQDTDDLSVLMLAWTNREAFELSLKTGNATFWSTSRHEIWEKGATSGDYLKIQEIRIDCDQDSILFLVRKQGNGACHTKNNLGVARNSCFYRRIEKDGILLFLDQ